MTWLDDLMTWHDDSASTPQQWGLCVSMSQIGKHQHKTLAIKHDLQPALCNLVSLAKERDLPSLEGEGEMSEPSETRNRESHDRNTGDSMTFAGMGEDGINDDWCNLHNAGCMMQVAGHVLWPRAAWLYHGATFLMAISLIVSGGSTNIWCLALSSMPHLAILSN